MGMQKPVHILQLNASVDEIVNMAAVAVIDAQQKEKHEQKREQITRNSTNQGVF
ncbi:NADP-dependent malic enzyme [Nonlabens ulvanivorans]|nr:NADP-dependent malic enzyme [Nonlabens ulvanivorans]